MDINKNPVTTSEQQAVPVAQEDHSEAIAFLDQYAGQDWSLDWLVANAIARHRLTSLPCKSGEGAEAVARSHADKWRKRAAKHTRANGRRSDCEQADLARAKLCDDIANDIAALSTPSEQFAKSSPDAEQGGEVQPIGDDEALEAVADRFNGSGLYGLTEAWAEGKTLSVLFKETGQIAKLRFVKLVDKPSSADLRGEPA